MYKEHLPLIGLLLVIIVMVIFVNYFQKKVEDSGIISVAKVLRFENGRSSSSYIIEIYYKDKKYITGVSNVYCTLDCVGKFYFVKFLKDENKSYPIIFQDKPVPACILDSLDYFNGWSSIPDCRTFMSELLTE